LICYLFTLGLLNGPSSAGSVGLGEARQLFKNPPRDYSTGVTEKFLELTLEPNYSTVAYGLFQPFVLKQTTQKSL